MNEQINKLVQLLNDLLDVSTIQTGELPLKKEYFDLNEMVRDVVKSCQQMTSKHELLVKGKIKEPLFADKARISEVLSNLCTNAIKYSPQGDKIIISLKDTKPNILVSVQDFGDGIPVSKQEKIFERFYRISEKNKKISGLGLGLYISANIIRQHGGEIKVMSRVGKGSTFSFTLPTSLVSRHESKKHILSAKKNS